MEMSSLVHQYFNAFTAKHGDKALPGHWRSLQDILRCRTSESGELYVQCPDCDHGEWRPLSCGNRNCPKCQNQETSRWIDKQQLKLLPVPYFMVTFTIPYELRRLMWCNQKKMYSIFFAAVASTLKTFASNHKRLGPEIGMTMVLHTNSRRLDYHPHIHVVVPGGALDKRRKYWKKLKGKYLFYHRNLAEVFRARFLAAVKETGFSIPTKVPGKWVVDCSYAGKGMSVLKYLSKYLYRGVISEKNIVSNQNGLVTFKYVDSDTGTTKYRKLPGEDFLELILQHVLPRGFRRVRDYGFLHGNAKRLLLLVQLILRVIITEFKQRSRPTFKCPCCKARMNIIEFRRRSNGSG